MSDSELPSGPITDDELRWLRRKRREEEHARWAMRLVKRVGFHLTWAFGAAWAIYEWIGKHITFKVGS